MIAGSHTWFNVRLTEREKRAEMAGFPEKAAGIRRFGKN
jgi:hypothetical protein